MGRTLLENADADATPELKSLRKKGKKLQQQWGQWLEQVLDYASNQADLEEESPLEPEDSLTVPEAIRALKGSIMDAIDRGYTLTEIAEMLTKKGLEMDAVTLQYHLSQGSGVESGG